MLLQESGEIGAFRQREPDAFDLHVGDDWPPVRGLAHTERHIDRLRILVAGGIGHQRVDHDVVGRTLHRSGHFQRLPFVFAEPRLVHRDRIIGERRGEGIDVGLRRRIRILPQREHADALHIGEPEHEIAELRAALIGGKRRAVEDDVAFVDVLLNKGFGRVGGRRPGRRRKAHRGRKHEKCGNHGRPGRRLDETQIHLTLHHSHEAFS